MSAIVVDTDVASLILKRHSVAEPYLDILQTVEDAPLTVALDRPAEMPE